MALFDGMTQDEIGEALAKYWEANPGTFEKGLVDAGIKMPTTRQRSLGDPRGLFDPTERARDGAASLENGSITLTPVGKDNERFVLGTNNDLGFNSDYVQNIIANLEASGNLPPNQAGLGWELHGKDKDGNFIISHRNPDSFSGFDLLPAVVAAVATSGAGGAGLLETALGGTLKAVSSGVASGNADNLSASDIASSIALNAVANDAVLDEFGAFGDAYRADNIGGAFVRGATNSTINQAVGDGSLNLDGVLKSALINAGFETAQDLFGDARQTRDGNLIEGVDTVDGRPMTPADVDRLTNTADLYGLLGDGGLLSKVGLDVGYLPTGLIGGAMNFFNLGDRPIVDPEGAHSDRLDEGYNFAHRWKTDSDEKLMEQWRAGDISYNDLLKARIANAETARDMLAEFEKEYLRATSRYDEREFLLFEDRGESSMSGIWEFDSTRPSNTGATIAVEGDAPSRRDPVMTPKNDPEFAEYMARNPTASLDDPELDTVTPPLADDSLFIDTDLVLGQQSWEESFDFDEIPSGEESSLPPSDKDENKIPPSDKDGRRLPSDDLVLGQQSWDGSDTPVIDELPPSISDEDIPSKKYDPSSKSIVQSVFQGSGLFDDIDLFGYTRLSPSRAAKLGPMTDYMRALRDLSRFG